MSHMKYANLARLENFTERNLDYFGKRFFSVVNNNF